VCIVTVFAAVMSACAARRGSVQLQPEEPTTLHVGQTATVTLASHYATIGMAGDALALVRQVHQPDRTIYSYRAVSVGSQTLITAPADVPDGQCISCVTLHYFVRVID